MSVLVSVSDYIEGYQIVQHKDIVIGIGNSIADGYMYREAAIRKASELAESMGANAVTSIHIDVHHTGEVFEAAAIGNAVVVKSLHNDTSDNVDLNDTAEETEEEEIPLEAFSPQNIAASEVAQIVDSNGYKFMVCPKCGSKYKADVDNTGHVKIKGFEDVDDEEPGMQIYCMICGSKFTVPDSL